MIIVKFVKNVACLLMCLFNKAGCILLLIMLVGSSLDVAKTIWQAFFFSRVHGYVLPCFIHSKHFLCTYQISVYL